MQWKSYKIIFLVELIVLVNNQWYVNFGYVTFGKKNGTMITTIGVYSPLSENMFYHVRSFKQCLIWGFSLLRFPRSSSFMFCGFTFFLKCLTYFFSYFLIFLAFLNNIKTHYTTAAMSGQNGNVEFDRSRWANKRSQHALNYLY